MKTTFELKTSRLFFLLMGAWVSCAGQTNQAPLSDTVDHKDLGGIFLRQDSSGFVKEMLQLGKDGTYFYYFHTDILDAGSAGTWISDQDYLYLTSHLTEDSIEISIEELEEASQGSLRVEGINHKGQDVSFCQVHVKSEEGDIVTFYPGLFDTLFLLGDFRIHSIQVSDTRDYQSVWKPVSKPLCRAFLVELSIPPIVSGCMHKYYSKHISEKVKIEGTSLLWPMEVAGERRFLTFRFIEETDPSHDFLLEMIKKKRPLYVP